jgi:GMP synthase (glutamine-hydrolysing)
MAMSSKASAATKQLIIMLDFGAQYSQLIARRVRECRVYCEIMPYDTPLEEIVKRQPMGIIFSGGPSSVYEEGAPTVDPRIYDLRIPILGICYGMQVMAFQLGGGVVPQARREYGKTELDVLDNSDLFAGLNPELICWMSHGDAVQSPPPGFRVSARTGNSPVAAMSNPERKLFGVQFHPEVVHTPWGIEVMRNFLYNECGCGGLWTMESYVKLSCDAIKKQVGSKSVICGLSGGID